MKTDYEAIAREIGELTQRKGRSYGDSAAGKCGAVLALLWPSGIPVERMDIVPVVSRIIDKLFRVANQPRAFGEDPFRDIAGYALVGASMNEQPDPPDDDGPVTL